MTLSSQPVIAFIPTRDYEKAREFYVDTLGLTFLKNDGFAMVLKSADVMIRVVKVDFNAAPFTIFGWMVGDMEEAVSELSARGIRFERYDFMKKDGPPYWDTPDGNKVAWFKDPDGNVLSLSQHE